MRNVAFLALFRTTPPPLRGGEMQEEVFDDSTDQAVKNKNRICPREVLHKILYDSGLNAVRAALDAIAPKMLLL